PGSCRRRRGRVRRRGAGSGPWPRPGLRRARPRPARATPPRRGRLMTPILPTLVPFYRADRPALAAALAPPAGQTPGAAELILYDDGSSDPALMAGVEAALRAFPGAARLIQGGVNRGRAAARNALAEAASAQHLLFLDADMLPQDGRFLARW